MYVLVIVFVSRNNGHNIIFLRSQDATKSPISNSKSNQSAAAHIGMRCNHEGHRCLFYLPPLSSRFHLPVASRVANYTCPSNIRYLRSFIVHLPAAELRRSTLYLFKYIWYCRNYVRFMSSLIDTGYGYLVRNSLQLSLSSSWHE